MRELKFEKAIRDLINTKIGLFLSNHHFMEGDLLAVKQDHLVIDVNQNVHYIPLQHIKALSKNAKDYRVTSTPVPYLDIRQFTEILNVLKYSWVTINGPEKDSHFGVLNRIAEDHIVLINQTELLYIPTSYISNIHGVLPQQQIRLANENEQQTNQPALQTTTNAEEKTIEIHLPDVIEEPKSYELLLEKVPLKAKLEEVLQTVENGSHDQLGSTQEIEILIIHGVVNQDEDINVDSRQSSISSAEKLVIQDEAQLVQLEENLDIGDEEVIVVSKVNPEIQDEELVVVSGASPEIQEELIAGSIASPEIQEEEPIAVSVASPEIQEEELIAVSVASPEIQEEELITVSMASPDLQEDELIAVSVASPEIQEDELIAVSVASPEIQEDELIAVSWQVQDMKIADRKIQEEELIAVSVASPEIQEDELIAVSVASPEIQEEELIAVSVASPEIQEEELIAVSVASPEIQEELIVEVIEAMRSLFIWKKHWTD